MKSKKSVLIIEDERTVAAALETKLRSEGFETMIAPDGETAIETALRERPDLILLDLLLPKLDGFSVLERLREDDWGRAVPVIVLTNLSDASTEVRSLATPNVKGFMVKSDWSLTDVVKRIKDKLES